MFQSKCHGSLIVILVWSRHAVISCRAVIEVCNRRPKNSEILIPLKWQCLDVRGEARRDLVPILCGPRGPMCGACSFAPRNNVCGLHFHVVAFMKSFPNFMFLRYLCLQILKNVLTKSQSVRNSTEERNAATVMMRWKNTLSSQTVSSNDTFVQQNFIKKLQGPEGWGARRVHKKKGPNGGVQKGRGTEISSFCFPLPPPIFCVFPSPSPASHFSLFFPLSGSLFVEMWPRVAATDHPNCASGAPLS